MWQIICVCLPMMTKEERQHFLALFGTAARTYDRELSEVDPSLAFLYLLTPPEALTVLEERRELVVRSQAWLATQSTAGSGRNSLMHLLVHDHIHTRLSAERAWLERTIRRLRAAARNELEQVLCQSE